MAIGKPNDYDKIPVGGERLQPGGHRCVIKQAEEQTSKNGSQMLVISFDTDLTDAQPKFYENRWLSDKREDKKWGGKMYVVVEGEYGPSNLKRFCTAVEDSNEGFDCWSDKGELKLAELKDKLVGIVFREEEYTAWDGQVRRAVKGFRFCDYHKATDQSVPDPKPLQQSQEALDATRPASLPQADDYGFVNVVDGLEDEGLPFK